MWKYLWIMHKTGTLDEMAAEINTSHHQKRPHQSPLTSNFNTFTAWQMLHECVLLFWQREQSSEDKTLQSYEMMAKMCVLRDKSTQRSGETRDSEEKKKIKSRRSSQLGIRVDHQQGPECTLPKEPGRDTDPCYGEKIDPNTIQINLNLKQNKKNDPTNSLNSLCEYPAACAASERVAGFVLTLQLLNRKAPDQQPVVKLTSRWKSVSAPNFSG